MSEIRKLDWDSDFFSINVAEVKISGVNTIINENLYDLIYVIQQDESNLVLIEGYELTYAEEKIVFSKIVNDIGLLDTSCIVEYNSSYDLKSLYKLAYISGEFSRFKLDFKFEEGKFERLYELWIDRSIEGIMADKIFLYVENRRILGLITFKIDVDRRYGTVGLLGVDGDSQGKGIGSLLLKHLEKFSYNIGINTIYIPTQKHNLLACKFYKRNSYLEHSRTIIKHYWKI